MATDLLAQIRAEIDARIAALRPAVEEYERVLSAAEVLEREAASAQAAPSATAQAAPSGAGETSPAAPARRRGPRGSAAGAIARAASSRQGPTEQAIVAALEHGSHSVSELVVVTAMSGPQIRASLRVLQRAGKVARTKREGRAAYALAQTA
ncbi:MAG TPA: hypothetical protein VK272_13095 [Solirubrobacteraceae bacterium]|nr:hypothetical protein [Solirubrobacteraceae bacterium]